MVIRAYQEQADIKLSRLHGLKKLYFKTKCMFAAYTYTKKLLD